MAKYDVYRNPDGPGYLLDLQSDLLDAMASRLVAPLIPVASSPRPANRLNPVLAVEGTDHMLLTQAMAAVPARILEKPVTNLSDRFAEITRAVDMVFQGF